MVICIKSSDQGVLQRGDQAACKRVRPSKTNIVRLSAGISSDQGPFLGAISPIKNLDPGCKWFNRRYECDYPLYWLLIAID